MSDAHRNFQNYIFGIADWQTAAFGRPDISKQAREGDKTHLRWSAKYSRPLVHP